MKIRTYLALMVAAILVPVTLFAAISLNMLLKSEREAAMRGVRETARTSLVSIDRELTNAQSAVRMLATSHYLNSGDLANVYAQLRFADKAGTTWTALFDESGRQLLSTAVPFGTPMPTAPNARVATAFSTGIPQISNMIRGAMSRALIVVVDVPVSTDTGKRYVISQGFRVEHFIKVLKQVNAPPSWVAGVYDRNGITIAQLLGVDDGSGEARPDLRRAILSETEGVISNRNDAALHLYTVLVRSSLSGWTVAVGVPEAEVEMAARKALFVAALGMLAALACAGGAALFFARRLSHAIGLASQQAHALKRGDVVGHAEVSGVAEVDALQAAIVAAARVVGGEKQSRRMAELEREKLFASEHAARTMAEQQNRAKDEFLAMLGHELRNPLAAIVNATGVIGHPEIPPDRIERAREIVARQSAHLTRIVDDLLDVGRVHSGKILLARRVLRIDTLVETCIATLRATGRASAHALSFHATPAWVDADPTRLEQVIANLLDNAFKYTPAGGAIKVTVDVEGKVVLLCVSDTGVGIAPELMPHVFDLFVQGERALDRAQGGLGVGLALVQRLAAMHDGHVAVRSEGKGCGSCFELRLPSVGAPQDGPELDAQPAAPTRRSILLVEDNDDIREMMSLMLEAQQYAVVCAIDGLEGLRLATDSPSDVALVDIGLPGIDGYEVARRLRANPATTGMRLIALTGYGLESDQRRALEAGFDAHLVKPVDLNLLIETIE
jgi:signal transduction histidine kinase/CheY-like chemotaxis protein